MNRIDAVFAKSRPKGNVFIPFLTAGDPDIGTTVKLARELIRVGESLGVPMLLEIGFPYSDPIADGAVIQASYTRALAKKIKIAQILDAVRELRKETESPLAAMVSYSLVHRNGGERFLELAQSAGIDGAIIPDLPVEEARALHGFSREKDFKIIQLIAPTTPGERAKEIARTSSGFVYLVSVTGITGERDKLPVELPERVKAVRRETDLPVCVGFGIGKPEHVEVLKGVSDGVIVGSAIVRKLEREGVKEIGEFVRGLMQPLAK